MDTRLGHLNGRRFVGLKGIDLPQLAQAIVDVERGRARVRVGSTQGTPYVQLTRDGIYDVVVRGEDWAKILPFFRSNTFSNSTLAAMPEQSPPDVMSPQPKRTMSAPYPVPDNGLTSPLEGLDYATARTVVEGLSATSFDQGGRFPARRLDTSSDAPRAMNPQPPTLTTEIASVELNFRKQRLYNQVLAYLYKVFSEDFPTTT